MIRARFVGMVALAVGAAGCRQQMAVQPSVRPLRPTPFFAEASSARGPVAGTVARGQLREDDHFYRGVDRRAAAAASAALIAAGQPAATPFLGGPALVVSTLGGHVDPFVHEFPMPITRAVLEQGRVGYGVFCAICHDAAGTGAGIVPRRGFTRPPSYHIPRLREARVGYLFDVITNGRGAMPDHASQIEVAERWAIVAYVRVLQRSQFATIDDVPKAKRAKLMEKEKEKEKEKEMMP